MKNPEKPDANILNSGLYRAGDIFISLVLLNLLWLVACIPLITIWPSTAAMFGVVRDWINGTDSSIVMPFARHFRANLGQSLGIGLLWLATAGVLFLDFNLIAGIEEWLKIPLFLLLVLATFVLVLTSTYLFPVMVNYHGNWRNVLKNSFLIAVAQPLTTLLCLLVIFVALTIGYFLPATALVIGSGTAYVLYFLCKRAFDHIEHLKGIRQETPPESETWTQ